MLSEIFVPIILECDSLNNEDKLETKDNRTVGIDNTTVCITESDDLDRPQKLVKGIYDDKNTPTLDLEDETVIKNCTGSYDSAGNTSFTALEVYELHDDTPVCNYRGPKVSDTKNETPVTICTYNTIVFVLSPKLLRVLLDSGSTGCLIKIAALPKGAVPKTLAEKKSFKLLDVKLTTGEMVIIKYICLPDFDKNRSVAQQRDIIFDNDSCRYDIILGTNFLPKTSIKLYYERGNME